MGGWERQQATTLVPVAFLLSDHALLPFVVDCKNGHRFFPSHQKVRSFPHLLNLSWSRDLLWAIECDRSDNLPVLNLGPKRHCVSALTLGILPLS